MKNDFKKWIVYLVLSFTAGVMIAHAERQPIFNEINRIEAELEAYRQTAYWVCADG